MSLRAQIESLLFVSAEPLSIRVLARLTGAKSAAITKALTDLQAKYQQEKEPGMIIIQAGETYQMVTHPRQAALVAEFLKADLSGDLTEPSLETLTIIAYRGPITKPELEQIRGVNCSLILRNLLMRGLITRVTGKSGLPNYEITADFVRYLGLSSVAELPDYSQLHEHQTLNEVLQSVKDETKV
ncbi:MAG: SMC-Scp complex subunit ScpB [Candidatus Komeilibacteria bacterium]|nr:SMC-Scp complex subunit ScpB [Candidatus Komeilibacteria bacterium]